MTRPDFSNTEIAFAYKSDSELRHAYLLFSVISKRSLVAFATPLIRGAVRLRLPVKPLIRATIYRHFCGGESIDRCTRTVAALWKFGVGSILDYSVEGKENEETFRRTAAEIIRTIRRSAGDASVPFCVFKPSGIVRTGLMEKVSAGLALSAAERQEYEAAAARFDAICSKAAENDVRIFIDAEETWFQDAIDRLVQELMHRYNTEKAIVFNTVQLYRTGRLDWMDAAVRHARDNGYKLGLKLVRGAYMEKERARAASMGYPSPIQPDKPACDNQYDGALRFCMDHLDTVSFCNGTHNEKSSMLLTDLMQEKNVPANDARIWFSQLLGMSDHISFNLAHAGYNVCKYVPYGPVDAVLPYLVRRAEENSAIAGQMNRELGMIVKERGRRKRRQ